ncbi:MAG TPA: sigma factor-like helix-turn-helix DNA-binding protein [Streptosporangiaceae bacterium]|nr:sigma factor-like helix-turn-helix DNA-binding protein [Streptosporangiaceae bacterium]
MNQGRGGRQSRLRAAARPLARRAPPHDRPRLLSDRQAAGDVAQEAFVPLDQHIGRLEDISEQRAYVRTIAVGLCRPALRRRFGHDNVMEALRQLPACQRRALVLRFCEEMSEAEIAGAMGCKAGAIRPALFPARRSLACLLEDEVPA